MAADWKRVAAARLKEIRLLRHVLYEDRAQLARSVRREIEKIMHAKCVAAYAREPWKSTLDEIEKMIGRTGKIES